MKNKKITKKVTKEKLLRIIKRRDTQSLLAIQEDQFDWEVLKQFVYEYKTLLEWIVSMGYVFKKEENLKRVVNDRGQTVAHVMASQGYRFDPDKDTDIISLADNEGWTVAHEMAKTGYLFDPDRHGEICELKDGEGYSILEHFILRNHREILDGGMDQDFIRLSPKGIQKYVQAAERLENESYYLDEDDYFDGMYVYEYLKKIFIRKELEKELGSLGLKL